MSHTPIKYSAAEKFYTKVLSLLLKEKIPFMIGGTYAFTEYTGLHRETKDLDIFCKTSDYPKILDLMNKAKYKTEITDARWLAKVFKNNHYVDLIYSSRTDQAIVDQTWFDHAPIATIFGHQIRLMPPEELIWSKVYSQNRDRFEGPDINHMILRCGNTLDWKRLLMRMENHWELLLAHLITFRFVYPSERGNVPKWLMEEMLARVKQQLILPIPKDKVCRGILISSDQYHVDFHDWGFRGVD